MTKEQMRRRVEELLYELLDDGIIAGELVRIVHSVNTTMAEEEDGYDMGDEVSARTPLFNLAARLTIELLGVVEAEAEPSVDQGVVAERLRAGGYRLAPREEKPSVDAAIAERLSADIERRKREDR